MTTLSQGDYMQICHMPLSSHPKAKATDNSDQRIPSLTTKDMKLATSEIWTSWLSFQPRGGIVYSMINAYY